MSNMVTQPPSLADITFEPLFHKRERDFCPAGGSTAVFRCFGVIRCHFFLLQNTRKVLLIRKCCRRLGPHRDGQEMGEMTNVGRTIYPFNNTPPPHTVSAEVALVLIRWALISMCLISVGRILTLKLLLSAFRRLNAGGHGALLRPSGRRTG